MAKNPLDSYLEGQDKESAVHVNLMPPAFSPPKPPGFAPSTPAGVTPLAAPTSMSLEELQEKQHKEMELWHNWNNNGRKHEDLQPLIHSMRPLIQERINVYSGRVNIPPDALEAEFKNQAVKAIKTYEPDRGAKLSTWVRSNIRKGGRFVSTYQNVGRIVEDRVGKISEYKLAKDQLAEQHGRPPTDSEVARHLGWSVPEVHRMNSEMRADIMSSSFESDPTEWSPNSDTEVMAYLHEELSPEEKQVFQYMHTPGKTQGKTGLIAKEIGWHPSKVSRLRKAIEAKAMHYRNTLESN